MYRDICPKSILITQAGVCQPNNSSRCIETPRLDEYVIEEVYATMNNEAVLCPRCKIPMDYVMEAEKVGGERRLTRYYQCPACRTKILDERITIKSNTKYLIITILDYSSNGSRPIISTPREKIRRGSPRGRSLKIVKHSARITAK